MQTIFYSPSKNHEVVDISGVHDLTTIQAIIPVDKRSGDYQMVQLGPTEAHRFDVNGNLTKFDFVQERQQKQAEQKSKDDAAKAEVAAELKKLGVSDKAISALTRIPEANVATEAAKGDAAKVKP